jgi:hypothetical protein
MLRELRVGIGLGSELGLQVAMVFCVGIAGSYLGWVLDLGSKQDRDQPERTKKVHPVGSELALFLHLESSVRRKRLILLLSLRAPQFAGGLFFFDSRPLSHYNRGTHHGYFSRIARN